MRSPSPGATNFGNSDPSQADGPRLLNRDTCRSTPTEPTLVTLVLFAGLVLVLGAGPRLPAEYTTEMSAARSASMSAWKAVLQTPSSVMPQESLTTSGASSVSGLPSGSSSHWNTSCTALSVVTPALSKIRPAIHCASGAMPMAVPPASPPRTRPAT